MLTDSVPRELIESNSQYQFKFILTWRMTSLSHEIVYDYLHPIDIPSIFHQRVGTEIMLSFNCMTLFDSGLQPLDSPCPM